MLLDTVDLYTDVGVKGGGACRMTDAGVGVGGCMPHTVAGVRRGRGMSHTVARPGGKCGHVMSPSPGYRSVPLERKLNANKQFSYVFGSHEIGGCMHLRFYIWAMEFQLRDN